MMENVPNIDLLRESLPDITINRHVSTGGFKAVYEALIEGRREALKLVYWPEVTDEREAHIEIPKRLEREISGLRECSSPYLVKLGSVVPREHVIAGHRYLLYSEEFLGGIPLRQRIASGYRPNYQECRSLFICLLDVIDKLNDMNLVHRDIKPDNVMESGLSDRPYVVLDLGIAFKIGGTVITINRSFPIGTLPYMAPEAFGPHFREIIDHKIDLYSAALTVYEFSSGTNPICQADDDLGSTIIRIIQARLPRLRQLRTDFPPRFCDLIDQLMNKIPALRPRISIIKDIMEGI